MATKTKIEWTEMTWNPVTGCTKVSSGCLHCYAERMSKRLQNMGSKRYANGFQVTLHEDLITLPMIWKKPCMIFVNSMSDLFHEQIPFSFIKKVFDTMEKCPQHTFQVLTKRSQRLKELAPYLSWPSNVWIGVTVENQATQYRIDDLKTVPAYIKFISCEPLLSSLNNLPLEGIDWVIVGGESGPKARLIEKQWIEEILRQCRNANCKFFFKQWGGTRKKQNGCTLNNRMYKEFPERIAPTLHSKQLPLSFDVHPSHKSYKPHIIKFIQNVKLACSKAKEKYRLLKSQFLSHISQKKVSFKTLWIQCIKMAWQEIRKEIPDVPISNAI